MTVVPGLVMTLTPQGLKRAIATAGGDTLVKGAYHRYYNLSLTGDSWADARGASGYGPSLVLPASLAFDATGIFLKFVAPQSAYAPSSELFDCGYDTWVGYVGTVGTAGTFEDVCDFYDNTTGYGCVVGTELAGEWANYTGSTFEPLGVTDATPIPRFTWIFQTITNSGTGACNEGGQVWAHAKVSSAEFANGTAATNFMLNTSTPNTTSGEDTIDVRSVLFVSTRTVTGPDAMSAAQVAQLSYWAIADAGIKVAA
jgi:hypothetical protein